MDLNIIKTEMVKELKEYCQSIEDCDKCPFIYTEIDCNFGSTSTEGDIIIAYKIMKELNES